jgi:hypothetical protein
LRLIQLRACLNGWLQLQQQAHCLLRRRLRQCQVRQSVLLLLLQRWMLRCRLYRWQEH